MIYFFLDMDKKTYIWILVGVISAFLLAQIGVLIWKNISLSSINTKEPKFQPNNIHETYTLLRWEDPAGIAFEYPDILVSNIHEEDQENYAHIEFTHDKYNGSIIIWASDAPTSSSESIIERIDDWAENQTMFDISSALESSMAGLVAKKYRIQDKNNSEIIATLYDDIIWYVEAHFIDDSFWRPIYGNIVDSLEFIEPIYEDEGEYEVQSAPVVEQEYFDDVEVLE